MRNFINIVSETNSETILTEGQQYLDMFKWLWAFCDKYKLPTRALEEADTVCERLKRKDAQTWAARILRIDVLRELTAMRTINYPEGVDPDAYYMEFINTAKAQLTRYATEYQKSTGKAITTIPLSRAAQEIRSYWIGHYSGIQFNKIQNYRFDLSKTMGETWAELESLEIEYGEVVSGKLTMQDGDEIIYDFGNGFSWMLLSRGYCSDEAQMMGHCGNSGAKSGDRILSLRKFEETIDGVSYYTPCLTFILERDGYLGEMKGRANEKPAARYHPYIVTLLKMDIIKGIRGGGWLPENNFSLKDLPESEQDAILDIKPSLGTLEDRYRRQGDTPELRQDVAHWLVENVQGFGYRIGRPSDHKSFWENDRHVVDKWSDIRDFVQDIATDRTTLNLVENDPFSHWDFTADRSSVESVLSDLPLQLRIALGNHAERLYRENDEEGEDDFDSSDDGEVAHILEEYDADAYSVLLRAWDDGSRVGAESEAIDALFEAVKDAARSVVRGKLTFEGTYDSEMVLSIDLKDAIKIYVDFTHTEDYDIDDHDFIRVFWNEDDADEVLKVDEPYYGWDGYDKSAAIEYAIDNLEIDFENERSPYLPDFFNQSQEDNEKIITELYARIPDGYIRKVNIEGLDNAKIASVAEGLWRKFYNLAK